MSKGPKITVGALRETLHRADPTGFEYLLRLDDSEEAYITDILEEKGLERALWSVRALKNTVYDTPIFRTELRLLSLKIVQIILEADRQAYTSDTFPNQVFSIVKKYCSNQLTAKEIEDFNSKRTYDEFWEKKYANYSSISPYDEVKLIGFTQSSAVIELLYPDVMLAAYFSILTIQSRRSTKENLEINNELKIGEFRKFLERYQ